MSHASPITRQTVGKTFIIAVSVLGIGAVLQLGGIAWVFISRLRAGPAVAETGEAAAAVPAPVKEFTDPFSDDATPPSAATAAIPASTPPPARAVPVPQFPFKPVPITPEAAPPAPADSRFAELVEQAKTLRERGDTYTALTRFREAQALEPQNPVPMAEIATTYERMGLADKAAEQWRRIYDLGEPAGVYYTAAEAKMRASQAQAILKAMPNQGEPSVMESAPPSPGASDADTSGIPPGYRLGLGNITRVDQGEMGGLQRFILRVPVKARPKARIDVSDVTIQVLFYDAVNGRTLERTNAEVSTRWSNPPADWSDDDVETVEVSYSEPPPTQGEPLQERKFYGYLVRVYYKDALQDSRAEPARLAQQFPAPRTLEQTPASP